MEFKKCDGSLFFWLLMLTIYYLFAKGGSYGMKYGRHDATFPAPHGEGYGVHMGAADKGPLYGATSASWGGLEKPQMNRR